MLVSSNVVNYILQACLQIPLKEDVSKFLEELVLGTYHTRIRFLDRVAEHRTLSNFTKK